MAANRAILTGVTAALVIGLGGWAITRRGTGEQVTYKTATVEQKDLQQTVSATGTVQPFTVVDIKSRAGGEVKVLAVEVGTKVKAGDLIARIDPTDSQTTFDQAAADVRVANARISQAQQTTSLQAITSRTSIREAEARVSVARAQLAQSQKQAQVQPLLSQAEIRRARAALQTALRQVAQLKGTTDPQARADAQSAFNTAKANLTNANLNLNRQQQLAAKGFVAEATADTARAARDVAQANLDSAKTRLETVGVGQQASIDAAQSRVNEAQEALRTAEANQVQIALRKQDVASAQASLTQALAGLDTARANQAQVSIRAADVETNQAQSARAKASLQNSRIVLDSTTIRSPRNGVVLQKYIEQGTIISSGQSFNSQGTSLVQIGDLSRVFVDAAVDESDINQVQVGQKVKLTLDALPDKEFDGRVRRIEPRGVTDQNVTTIKTQIEILNPDPLVRPGLNAECTFIVAEKANVLVVPARAVKTDQGKKTVQVLVGKDEEAKPETREITIGMETGDAVEIVSGLKPGDKVVTQTIEPGGTGGGKPGGDGRGGQGGGFGGGGRGF